MRLAIALALSAALALLAVACNGGGERLPTATPAPSPSATPAATATAAPSAEYPPKVSLTERGVYLIRPDGTDLRHLTPGQEGFYTFSWSPDGSRVAVVTSACSSPRVSVVDVDGEGAVEVAAFDGNAGGPEWVVWGLEWSPDGRQLAVPARSREEDPSHQTLLVNADGSGEPIDLFEGWPLGWSPDGKSLAFSARSEEGETLSIFDMATRTAIVIDKGRKFTSLASWSPDSQRIAYSMWQPDATHDALVVIDRDGENRRVIAERGSHPQWSPDGKYVAFSTGGVGIGWDIAVALADGSQEYVRLVPGQTFRWSPKGDAILAWNVGPHLRLVSLATHEAHDLADDVRPVQPSSSMSFSPDGEQLVFIGSDPQEEAYNAHNALYVMKIDGTGLQKLVKPSMAVGWGFEWSPDGRYIAFVDTIIGGCE